MTFGDYRDGVLMVCGDHYEDAMKHTQKVDKVLAAAAIVIRKHGAEWCQQHPRDFYAEVKGELGWWLNIGFTILSFLIPTAGVYLGILKWLLPAVLEWLRNVPRAYGCDSPLDHALFAEARVILGAN